MRQALVLAVSLGMWARPAFADHTSTIVTNNQRGSSVQTYRSGPGTQWSRTSDITQRFPNGTIHTVFNTGSGTSWSRTSTITRQTPNGAVTQTYTTGSQ